MISKDVFDYLENNPEAPRIILARRNFRHYISYVDPKFKFGWWNLEICQKLQSFYEKLKSGSRPVLIIEAPPQHGKSYIVMLFLSWIAGQNPEMRKIYASFSERLGVKTNLQLQRVYDSPRYQKVFLNTRLNASNVVKETGQYLRNKEVLEYVDKLGSFRNTTVRGAITGESLDLGVLDDPIKGREQANSPAMREKTWEWFTDDFLTRFSNDAGLLIVLTRWHVDDVVGRLIELIDDVDGLGQDIEVYSRPALIECEDDLKDGDPRKIGDALFPELKSKEFLEIRKKTMLRTSWESLYQQRPYIRGGNMFSVDMFKIVDDHPPLKNRAIRYWDKASTEDGGAYTAGVKIQETEDGKWIVLDVVRKQMSPLERERRIKQTAEIDGKSVLIYMEQEGGSGGKESIDNSIRSLAGFSVHADRVTGSKEIRAESYAAQVEGGNVMLLKAKWNKDFIDEHELFPNGKYKDQVDAAAGAFNKLIASPILGFTEKQKKVINKKRNQQGVKSQW